jgi:hypothetical protein
MCLNVGDYEIIWKISKSEIQTSLTLLCDTINGSQINKLEIVENKSSLANINEIPIIVVSIETHSSVSDMHLTARFDPLIVKLFIFYQPMFDSSGSH